MRSKAVLQSKYMWFDLKPAIIILESCNIIISIVIYEKETPNIL